MIVIVKNATQTNQTWAGKEFTPGEEYTIPTDGNRAKWQNNDSLLTAVANGDAQIGNGTTYLANVNDAINRLKGNIASEVRSTSEPFASKQLLNGKKLFRRVHGVKLSLDGTSNAQSTSFTIPYTLCKMTSTVIVNGVAGDSVDFKVLDTSSGTVTGVPNYVLNQFGHGVYVSNNYYREDSEYDAELFMGLQMEITLTPVDTVARDVYFNITLHEVKD